MIFETDSYKKMRGVQLNIDYMCKVTGGPMYYMGCDLKTSHAGLNISEEEWKANMQYMAEALDACKVAVTDDEKFSLSLRA